MGITEVLLHEAFSPENYLQLIRVENRKSLIAGRFGEKIKGHDSQKSRLHWVTGGGGGAGKYLQIWKSLKENLKNSLVKNK